MNNKKLEIENLLTNALERHRGGQILEAQKIYLQILLLEPKNFSALQLMGLTHLQTKKYQDAIDYLNQAIDINPQFEACYLNRGIALQSLQKYDDAMLSYQNAIQLKQDYVEAYSNLGVTLYTLKRYEEALDCYAKAITINPNFSDSYSNRGNVYHELKRYDEAINDYKKAIKLNPEHVDAYLNQGNSLQELKRYEEALVCYENAIIIKPDYSELYYSIGNIYRLINKYGVALSCYDRAIKLNPNFADSYLNRGVVMQKLKRFEEALVNYNYALELKPNYPLVYSNRGVILMNLNRFDEAIESLDKAIKIDPNYKNAYSNLGLVFIKSKRFDDALDIYKKIIKLDPHDSQAYYDCGVVLQDQNKFQEAKDFYQKAISLGHKIAYHNLLCIQRNPNDNLNEVRRWEEKILGGVDRQYLKEKKFIRKPFKKRRLKLGYVSGDYYNHVISYFIEEIFKNHDRSRVEVYVYYNNTKSDEVTLRLMLLADYWVSISDLSDLDFYDRLSADNIDVLIDLSGFTAFNRMEVFAYRAAPVQIHYLGYPNSTGLTQMDYWIGDEILTPSKIESHFSEKIWRLPRVWISYKGKIEAPLSKWTPADNGSICVGSFNNLGKITNATIELWSKILKSLPEAYLLLITEKLGDAGNRQRIWESFRFYGIANDRIKLKKPITGNYRYLTDYDELDIALDPYGEASGGTTTCDALWMGVPVITLIKDDSPVAARISASILYSVGYSEWVTHSEDEYIEKVIALARNLQLRKVMRFEQRNRLLQSPLCDSKGLTQALEDAYEAMFNKWYHDNQVSDRANTLN